MCKTSGVHVKEDDRSRIESAERWEQGKVSKFDNGISFLGKMSFNDDEQIVVPNEDDSGPKPAPFVEGLVQVRPIKKNEAPLEQTNFTVMLELTGAGSGNDRHGVDIVTVLDVSGSMKGEKLKQLKTAMQFLIKKLSPIDRLSVVTFSGDSKRLCQLRQITKDSQEEIEKLVNNLPADGATNITAGLQTALKVINDRRFNTGREVAIMLMSDGEQNRGGDAATVPVGNVPVHTFGFGAGSDGGYDPVVLNAIANNSKGGTFSLADAQNTVSSNLSMVFSQCLGGLLTTVVQDLKLKLRKAKSEKIQKVCAGNYPQTKDEADGSVTIVFGNLYIKEIRNVIVDLLLPAVLSSTRGSQNILEYSYSYIAKDGPFDSGPLNVRIRRNGTSVEPERTEVIAEQTRLETAKMIKQARVLADENKLEDAKDKLVEAQGSLDDVDVDGDQANPLFEMLRYELQQLLRFMQSPELYKAQGRPFALSSETSHDRQRFAARGDVEKLRLFSTPRMDAYLEQAKSFQEDPSKPVPSVEEDVKEELKADPLGPIIGPLSYYLESAIQALKSIQDVLNASRA